MMRFYRITFIGGLAIGYVLGAQAGRERYEQLKRLARKATESPAMQQTAGALQAQAAATARSARKQATVTARSARDQATATVRSARQRATGMRKGSDKATRNKASAADVAGNGAMPQAGGDEQRPFVPVNGSFGDHDMLS